MINAFNKFKKIRGDNKNILVNIILALIIKGGSIFVALFTIPAYMRYFDNQAVLGTWLTIVAVLTWILNFDLGIGNGLRQKLVLPLVNNDIETIKKYISSAYILLGLVAFVIAIIGYILVGFINWNTVFGIDTHYLSNMTLIKSVRIVLIGVLIQFVLRIITSILYAMQRAFIPNLLFLCSTVLLLGFIYAGIAFGIENNSVEENLINLSYANIVAVNLPLLITTLLVFVTRLKGCLPKFSYFEKKNAQEVMRLGVVFLWLQIAYMVISNTNEFLISAFLGSANVLEYQVYNKLFTLSGTLIALGLTPIWSAITKARVEQNYNWIRKLNNILMLLGGMGFICGFLLIPFLQPILNLWLGAETIKVNYIYGVFFAISGGLFLWNSIISAMCNGFGELRVQMIFLTMGAVINIPLAYVLATEFNSYIAIVIANIVSMLPYCIIQPIWMRRYLNKICRTQNNQGRQEFITSQS